MSSSSSSVFKKVGLTALVALLGSVGYVTYASLSTLEAVSNGTYVAEDPPTLHQTIGTLGAYTLTTRSLPPQISKGAGFQTAWYQDTLAAKTGRVLSSQFHKCAESDEKLISLSVVDGYIPDAEFKGFESDATVRNLSGSAKWFSYTQPEGKTGDSQLTDHTRIGLLQREAPASPAEAPEMRPIECAKISTPVLPYPFKTVAELRQASTSGTALKDVKGRDWSVRTESNFVVARLAEPQSLAQRQALTAEIEQELQQKGELPWSRGDIALKQTSSPEQFVRVTEYRYKTGVTRTVTLDTRLKNPEPVLSMLFKFPVD